MSTEEEKKGCSPGKAMADCGTACCDCINSKTKEEWGILVFAYLCFYAFMTAWMAVHLTGLIATTPDTASFNGTESYSGETVTMGEPIYNGFLAYVATTANRPGDGEELPSDPWNGNSMRLYEQTKTSSDCGVTANLANCKLSNQVRLNNHYTIRTLPSAIDFNCTGTGITFSNCSNPWGNESLADPAGSAASCLSSQDSLIVHFPYAHRFPHIMQFDVQPTEAVDEPTDFDVFCEVTTAQISEEGDIINYANFLQQKYTFKKE